MKKKTKKSKIKNRFLKILKPARNSGRNGAVERSGTEAVRTRHFIPGFRVRAATSVATAIAVVIISVLTIFTIVKAGNITPPTGEPTAAFYTLSEIYQLITNNTTATEGGHSFAFSDSLGSTHYTLTEIYDALADLVSADQVKLGTTYLAVDGTLVPSGGTAAVGDLFNSKTAHLTGDWTLDTGVLNLACDTATFDGTLNLVADGYDGAGGGNNRWCITDSGDAAAGEMKTGKIAWVDGVAITGSGTQTLSATSEAVSAGYYSATTLSAVDSDLAVGNIRSGVDIFGVSGSLITNPLFGDDIASNVLNTAANPGTYDPNTCSTTYDTSNLNEGTVKSDTVFGNSQTGTLAPDGGTAGVGDLFNSATAHLTGDWNLDTGTLDLACNTAAFDGSANLVANDYDGAGTGLNRWCTTDTGDALATDLFNDKIGWVDGSEITGTLDLACDTATFDATANLVATAYDGDGDGSNRWCMTDSGTVAANEMKTGQIAWVDGEAITGTGTQNLSAASETVNAGYYEATTLSTIDSDLATGNILSGKTIFGVAGAYSGYPGTGWTGSPAISESTCDAQNDNDWYWFEDGNGDGDTADPEDGVCVKTTAGTAGSWNGYKYTTNYDNTYIAAYTCSDSFPSGTVATYSGLDSAGNPDTAWNDGDCALCQADCYDGQKDLPDQGGYTSNPGGSGGYYGPITPEILKEWKGTRLPTANDFFGFCGATNGDADSTAGDSAYHSSGASADTTIGNYGKNVGRGASSEYMDLSNSGNYEWLSEQHYNVNARVAGYYGCSYFNDRSVYISYSFRAVFRP